MSVPGLLAQPEYLQRRVIYQWLVQAAGRKKDLSAAHVDAVRRILTHAGSASVDLPYGITVQKAYDILSIRTLTEFPMELSAYRTRRFAFDGNLSAIPRGKYTKWFDYDKILTFLGSDPAADADKGVCSAVVFRTRETGDRIRTGQKSGTKTIKQYMVDVKIPRQYRDRIILPAAGHEILWVPGYQIHYDFRVGPETKTILEISLGEVSDERAHQSHD